MLVLNSNNGARVDARFADLARFLQPSDVLVVNNTRVIRARMHGRLERQTGASRQIEVFFAEPARGNVWRALCRPGRRIRPGDRIVFADGRAHGLVLRAGDADGVYEIELSNSPSVEAMLERHGELPVPPYLNRGESSNDAIDYQTVFASSAGAVAAPTAGLHFTSRSLDAVRERGVEILTVTLHVGIGTFLPVRSPDPRTHILRPERFELNEQTAERLRRARREGRRIVAVGTTTTRTLEFVVKKFGEFQAAAGEADTFILPGYQFSAVDALLTNFHLPRSTLLMLVSAFAGRELILRTYEHAVRERYRFYTYGDCMLITR
jgi:S-adenosylmethionine:tRNA ribosyltransferase-isomerase